MFSFTKRAMGAVLLAVPVVAALGVLRVYGGCAGTNAPLTWTVDAAVVEGPRGDAANVDVSGWY